MHAGVESARLAEVLRDYLPELASDEMYDHLKTRLAGGLPDAEQAETTMSEGEVAPPSTYDEKLDDGRLSDYFSHYARLWAGPVEKVASSSPVVARDNTIVRDFIADQATVVSTLMLRTLLEELYRHKAQNQLRGSTPQERYRSFREWVNSPSGHAELVERYPFLFHAARKRVRSAASYMEEVVGEVERNLRCLTTVVPGLAPDSKIVTVELGRGDTHNGGRSVAQVRFSSGVRVLYKPRPMEAEAGYNRLVAWMNERMGTNLRTVSVLLTHGGGFVEHVPTAEFAGTAREYFVQMGQLTGILHLLRASDIHHENVITGAGGPVVVDTETLLTPRMRFRDPDNSRSAARLAVGWLQDSVAGIGILPTVMRRGGVGPGMDVGAVGYSPGQQNPFRALAIRNPGRDDMFVELATHETVAAGPNQAVPGAAELPVPDQRDLIKGGFRRVMEYAVAHPDDVFAAIEDCLGNAQFRFVTNATVVYAQLLRMVTHPDAVSDPLVRAAILNRVILFASLSFDVADEEARQLAAWDVPYFSRSARSCALMARGVTVAADAFEAPALETVRDRISSLDADAVERELHMIDLSFVKDLPPDGEPTGFVPARRASPVPMVGRNKFLAEARRIGDQLVDTMLDGADKSLPATWVAPQIIAAEDNLWTPGMLGYDIYAGCSGVALALAGLARETGEPRYRDAALRVIEPFQTQLRSGALRETSAYGVGGMGGLAGAVYATATALRLLGEPGTMSAGELASELAGTATPVGLSGRGEAEVDFVTGLAGTLAACLALRRHAVTDADRALVEAAARVIAGSELKLLDGTDPVGGQVTEFTGFAHGATGIGPVLVEYGTDLDDPDARSVGLRIIDAVRDAYDERDRDWPRGWADTNRAYGWCHGAPGILLGSVTATRYAPSSVPTAQLARLAELTLQRGFGNNPSLCHGDLGSAEVVAAADRALPGLFDSDVARTLYPRLFAEVVEGYDERADTKYAYSNSLMLGQAGRAWSILRYLDPDEYPCVLRFD